MTFTDEDLETVRRLASARFAVLLEVDVADSLGCGFTEACAIVGRLLAAGLLVEWPSFAPGPAVIVAGPAAELLGLELVEGPPRRFAEQRYRWVKAGARERPRQAAEAELPELDATRIPDHRARDPLRATPLDEGLVDGTRWRDRRAPLPRILLGLSSPWPAAWVQWSPSDGTRCPCCLGRNLSPIAYCLVCSRSGGERWLEPVAQAERPRRPDDRLDGGTGRKLARNLTGSRV